MPTLQLDPFSAIGRPGQQTGKTALKAGKWSRRAVIFAVGLGMAVFAAVTVDGREVGAARPLSGQLDRLAELAGLGIYQVSLSGQRYTSDTDIFDALNLSKHRSMLGFSVVDARARIEALPWIDRARVLRAIPGRLEITVSEREPFAVWRVGSKNHLIDVTGRILAVIKPGGADHLPLVIGAGAPDKAKSLFTIMRRYPGLSRRLVAAERVGRRRWTLWFVGSAGAELAVHLPQGNFAAAIARLDRLDHEKRIFERALRAIDLRVAGQLVLRPRTKGRPAQARSQGFNRKNPT